MHRAPARCPFILGAKMKTIYTIGYEGLTIQQFLAKLKGAGIKHVIDVRAVPVSRKKGFSKTALKEALQEAGIEYQHEAFLGCPKEIRDAYKANQDWKQYRVAFNKYLDANVNKIEWLYNTVQNQGNTALVCFEIDSAMCHRSLITNHLSQLYTDIDVLHLC